MRKVHLVVIDPQNSFCAVVPAAEQQTRHNGELCVPGAWEDTERLATMIGRLGRKLSQIHVTLDSHHRWHIAHPCWFRDGKGNNPAPFTMIREDNGRLLGSTMGAGGQWQDAGEYTPALFGEAHKWTYQYVRELQKGNRYPHVIWPYHCLIGTTGHTIVPHLMDALLQWEADARQTVDKITKGSCRFVEHFSAVRAEVPHPDDPGTQVNTDFVNMLGYEADEVLISGEALSHCVANTFRDVADVLGDDFVKKCVLLQDASSNVPGFESLGQKFVQDMQQRGMKVTTTADYLR